MPKTDTSTVHSGAGRASTTRLNRSWCRHCVAARATSIKDDTDMEEVSYDHCFMRDQQGMELAKVLVSKGRATRMVTAQVVPAKGVNAYEILNS